MAKITIRDVAREAGLSVSSVSRILRGGQGHVYPQETYDRVREVAQRLGYQANVAARLLSQSTKTMIGMSIHFTEHPYLNRFIVALYQELLKQEYDPVFLDAQHLADDNASQPFPPPHMLAGLISLGIDLSHGWPRHYADLRQHAPIVAVQPVAAEAAAHVDVVHVDFVDAYSQACAHLISLGHRHIAYLGPSSSPSDHLKYSGWLEAAKSHGLSPEYFIPWLVGDTQSKSTITNPADRNDFLYQPESHQSIADVIANLTSFLPRVTALMCASDEVAIGLQSYLQTQGWRLPRDLSIVGYDGISMGSYVHPALTTIAPDYERTAQLAVEQLLLRITEQESQEEKPATCELLVKPQLIVRSSTAPVHDGTGISATVNDNAVAA